MIFLQKREKEVQLQSLHKEGTTSILVDLSSFFYKNETQPYTY